MCTAFAGEGRCSRALADMSLATSPSCRLSLFAFLLTLPPSHPSTSVSVYESASCNACSTRESLRGDAMDDGACESAFGGEGDIEACLGPPPGGLRLRGTEGGGVKSSTASSVPFLSTEPCASAAQTSGVKPTRPCRRHPPPRDWCPSVSRGWTPISPLLAISATVAPPLRQSCPPTTGGNDCSLCARHACGAGPATSLSSAMPRDTAWRVSSRWPPLLA